LAIIEGSVHRRRDQIFKNRTALKKLSEREQPLSLRTKDLDHKL
jgi:hypothetical protein